jgi:hypothetical protein
MDPHYFVKQDLDLQLDCRAGFGCGSGFALETKFRSFRGSEWSHGVRGLSQRIRGCPNGALKVLYRSVVKDSHHFGEKQDPDSVK